LNNRQHQRNALLEHVCRIEATPLSRPPWTVEEQDACFVVRDHNSQALAYVYFEDEPGRRSPAKLLSKDETSVAKLPELLRKP
jgi:hypothetical protein